ncbi:MerR family transcriptional regulator [Pseudoflavitalea sp. G-6-1-2]|uniref:MerR family transcriptional regulator n=1 Tax=Pseudoflavitalea sp. G-6-1-2 TaxID=2728841 RepID=UPI00146F5B47|nr:MerR family transcriptional regulator [Pseudoflavitalea sp. G-6-1-2]NML22047.1 MerR family transcriptional regulator [Pseudoflavitalea sp. G-6-1-2]
MDNYSVKKLARLAGVTVRTLHLYDKMGLLKPSIRTEARYRLYGNKELLRLQQILFYRELDFPLKDIMTILDDPAFDLEQALEGHKVALLAKKERINTLVGTIEKTLATLKQHSMLQAEDLYEGMPNEKMAAYRKEAISKWGQELIAETEATIKSFSKEEMHSIANELNDICAQLTVLIPKGAADKTVQQHIAKRMQLVHQLTGGKVSSEKMEYLRNLGQLYKATNADTTDYILPDAEQAAFIREATSYYLASKK